MELQRISIAAALGLCLWQPDLALSQAPAAPKPAAYNIWMPNEKVEVKWGGQWREATIVEKNRGWYLVDYSKDDREWVEPYRIRKVGSKEDNLGYCRPSPMRLSNEGPPNHKPGDPPSLMGMADPQKPNPNKAFTDDPAWKEVEHGDTRLISLESMPLACNLTPDPYDKSAFRLDSVFVTVGGMNGEAFDGVKSIAIPRQTSNLAYLCHISGRETESTKVRLEKIDLQTQRTAVWPMTSNTLLLDVSPNGKTVLFRSTGVGAGAANLLEVWSLQGATPVKTALFAPFHGNTITADIKDGLFVDATHFLVWNSQGDLTLWDLAVPKPVYTCKMMPGTSPAISGGGRQLAVASKNKILILDPLTGSALAGLNAHLYVTPSLNFSPSGGRLASLDNGILTVWDLKTGEGVCEFALPSTYANPTFKFVSEGHGLVGNVFLVDLERQGMVWSYTRSGNGPVTYAPDGKVVYVAEDFFKKSSALGVVRLPQLKAQQAAKTQAVPEMVIKPGMKVSLQLDLPVPEDEREKIQDALTAAIQAAGWELASNQPNVLQAFVKQGESQEVEYRTVMGAPMNESGRTKITFTPQICTLQLKIDGATILSMQSTSMADPLVQRNEGQSLQDAINEKKRTPPTSFLKTVRLPRYLADPNFKSNVKFSEWTVQGIEEKPFQDDPKGTEGVGQPVKPKRLPPMPRPRMR